MTSHFATTLTKTCPDTFAHQNMLMCKVVDGIVVQENTQDDLPQIFDNTLLGPVDVKSQNETQRVVQENKRAMLWIHNTIVDGLQSNGVGPAQNSVVSLERFVVSKDLLTTMMTSENKTIIVFVGIHMHWSKPASQHHMFRMRQQAITHLKTLNIHRPETVWNQKTTLMNDDKTGTISLIFG